LITSTLPTSSRAGVQLSLSKISTVHLTVRSGSTVVYTNSATVERGKPKLLWPTPAKAAPTRSRCRRRTGRQLRDRLGDDHSGEGAKAH